MKKIIVLVGGGGHCRACIDVLDLAGYYEVAGIVDSREKIGQEVLGRPIIGCDDDLSKLIPEYRHFLVTIGQIKSPNQRMRLFGVLQEAGAVLPSVSSPLAYISKHAQIGGGTIIMHHAVVNASAVIGMNCIINTCALVEHDCTIEDHCHVSTGAIVNGGVTVGCGAFLGSNAVIREGVEIGSHAVIGCGVRVLKDVPSHTIVK